jgi:MFS family permease
VGSNNHADTPLVLCAPCPLQPLFSLLYTVYSIPNVILPFFGGFFVDKFGARACLLVFTVCILVGQVCAVVRPLVSEGGGLEGRVEGVGGIGWRG